MTLLFAQGVEGAPITFWRLLRIELKSRDTSFFHAALADLMRATLPLIA